MRLPGMAGLLWLGLAVAALAAEPATWKPATAPLTTPWGAAITPTNVLPEYPRPQMVRPAWQNLNGLWECAFSLGWDRMPAQFERQILVPFPVESALSGVATRLDAQSVLWYRRRVTIPKDWDGQHILLHFGGVDWDTRVFIDGHQVGEHQGGFDPFTMELTEYVHPGTEQELLVGVMDPTESDQPRGKQSRKPEGVFYTAVSGIWQTVWLEPVPAVHIQRLEMTPGVENQSLDLKANVAAVDEDLTVEAIASTSEGEVGRVTGKANSALSLAIAKPRPWSPEDPFLYDLTVRLLKGGREVDRVTSYFGLRHIEVARETDGFVRIRLNGRSFFQMGVLDQGFWPDGLYTAPSDEALRHDLEFIKSGGFNLVRCHMKVECARWYYWCDRMGLLVWQDMPCANNNTREGRLEFEAELQRMLQNLHNHPAIVMWVLFNEGWGQYDTERLVASIQATDPSRLVNNASGWTDKLVGDVSDAHTYTDPDAPAPDNRRACILGEYGGFGLLVDGHTWAKPWAYRILPDAPTLRAWYAYVLNEARRQYQQRGLCAVVYTQLTDVENESNGLMTYDRRVAKIDPLTLAAIHSGEDRRQVWSPILTNALSGQAVWRYTFEPPGNDWFQPGYRENSSWREGRGGFGTAFTRGSKVGTEWASKDIWLRRTFTLQCQDLRQAKFQLHHDKGAEVYLNGVPAYTGKSFLAEYAIFDIEPAALAALHDGTNTIAVRCEQTAGGQYIDVGIVRPASPAPAP